MSSLDSALVRAADGDPPNPFSFRRFALALGAFIALPPILLAAFVIAVDPYYVFGSPSWAGINAVRPLYEPNLLSAKPYQVRRIRPEAVALGSSRAEVGLDPGHPGWGDARTFNFGLPASTSYEVMRAFLHAQAAGGPLKQAVVGLDFFAFNIFFPRSEEQEQEAQFAGRGAAMFADFLAAELAKRPHGEDAAVQSELAAPKLSEPQGGNAGARFVEEPEAETWNEALYLAVNPDVAAAIARKEFASGRDHYERAGRAEGRAGAMVPNNWNETQYLAIHPDVAAEVRRGTFFNGYHHYLVAGKAEGRADGTPPPEWNEALYLRLNPDVQNEIARGTFANGYHHYLTAGRAEGRESGMAPSAWNEERYLEIHPDVAAEVRRGTFLNGYHHYLVAGRAEGRTDGTPPPEWNEALYLRINPDVESEVARGTFRNGYHHYLAAGRNENRKGGMIPREWDEAGYLQVNPDVARRVEQGAFLSGYHHYLSYGGLERRLGGYQPSDWNEAGYLAANPEVRSWIALGAFRTGYLHYLVVGRRQGLLGGFPPTDLTESLRLRWPRWNKTLSQLEGTFRQVFSRSVLDDSIATLRRQSEPAAFTETGVRLFSGQDEALRKLGGVGRVIRTRLGGGGWGPVLWVPKLMYCFTNTDTGMTMFDPFRFMLRQAYAEGTDLRLFVTPLHAVNRTLLRALGIGERYEFWLKELVRINDEEAARAGKQPLPLWDFSDANTITREPIPAFTDPTPMRRYWEHSHYRKATGDLILDRIFGYSDPDRPLPTDFGVRLTAANVDAHIARSNAGLDAWAAANSELTAPIVTAARTLTTRSRQHEATCW